METETNTHTCTLVHTYNSLGELPFFGLKNQIIYRVSLSLTKIGVGVELEGYSFFALKIFLRGCDLLDNHTGIR